jgi:hypothetical protein
MHLQIFLIKYFKIWFIVIFYKELILKIGFGQSYGKDLLRRTIRKFILYFSEFCTNVRKFWKFNQISGIFKPNKYLIFLPGLKWTWVGWLHGLVGPLPGPSTTGSTPLGLWPVTREHTAMAVGLVGAAATWPKARRRPLGVMLRAPWGRGELWHPTPKQGWSVLTRIIRGANIETLTHNTHIYGMNTELLHEFLSYKRDT